MSSETRSLCGSGAGEGYVCADLLADLLAGLCACVRGGQRLIFLYCSPPYLKPFGISVFVY